MSNVLTREDLRDLREALTREEWNAVCVRIRERNSGGYPEDWHARVVDSGLYDRAQLLPVDGAGLLASRLLSDVVKSRQEGAESRGYAAFADHGDYTIVIACGGVATALKDALRAKGKPV